MHKARRGEMEAFISVQNLAEMYPNLTGPKQKPPDSPEVARRKIESVAHLPYLRVLPVTEAIVVRALTLCQQFNIRRQDYFDMQLVATMVEFSIPTMITENISDFAAVEEINAINPFQKTIK
jgi:hypothetical protein